jgi:uncharacterized membrane protein
MRRVAGETQLLHRTFMVSIAAKGIFGFFEIVGAVISFLISPAQIHAFAVWLTHKELQSEPNNVLAQFILHLGTGINTSETHYVAIYLLLHGLVKALLVWALLADKRWAYPWMMAALGIFIGTQTYQLFTGFSLGLLLLTLFDIFILWLTWRESKLHPRLPLK